MNLETTLLAFIEAWVYIMLLIFFITWLWEVLMMSIIKTKHPDIWMELGRPFPILVSLLDKRVKEFIFDDQYLQLGDETLN